MPYRIKQGESVPEGVRRIAREEAETALAAAAGDGPRGPRVHAARTCCKKLRGLLRLVRPHLGETYRRENEFLRDASRTLSAARDAEVVVKAFDDLARRGRLGSETAAAVRPVFAPAPAGRTDEADILTTFAEGMRAFRDRTDGWRPGARGFAAIEDGLTDAYGGGRGAMRAAFASDEDDPRHEWRKQAKYHWYHVRLLHKVWEPAMEARAAELERLSDLLGDDHDLAVLRGLVADATDLEPRHVEPVLSLVDRRRAKLLAAARPLGQRLYAEKPRAFTVRMRRYWKTWRSRRET